MTAYTDPIDRRTVLASSAIALTGLAGCVTEDTDDGNGTGGPGDGDDDNGDNAGNGTGNSDPSDDPAIESASIETTGTDCGGPDDDNVTAFSPDEDPVRVEGVLPAPNPCHEATLEAASVEESTLALTIDVEQDLPDDEECVQCHGAVEYAVSVSLVEDVEIDELHVDHATGGSFGIAQDSATERDHGGEEDADGEPEEGDDHDDDSGVEESNHEIVGESIETIDANCVDSGSPSYGASVEVEGDEVVIEGAISASTPCHRAVLAGTAVGDDDLRVAIDIESTTDEDEACITCTGVVQYEAIIEVTDAEQLSSVHVDHVGGGSYATGWDSASDEAHDGD